MEHGTPTLSLLYPSNRRSDPENYEFSNKLGHFAYFNCSPLVTPSPWQCGLNWDLYGVGSVIIHLSDPINLTIISVVFDCCYISPPLPALSHSIIFPRVSHIFIIIKSNQHLSQLFYPFNLQRLELTPSHRLPRDL